MILLFQPEYKHQEIMFCLSQNESRKKGEREIEELRKIYTFKPNIHKSSLKVVSILLLYTHLYVCVR